MCFEMLTSDATHIREQAKINAARVVQAAQNELRAANASQNAWVQSFSNQRRVKAAAKQADDLLENIGRNLDAATYGRVGERLAASEELGANLASAAAAGMGGSAVDIYNDTIRLNAAMNEEQGDRAVRTDLLGATETRGSIIEGGYAGMDNQIFSAGLDYTQFVDHKKMSGLTKVITTVAAAGATYFGGPQAGKAVFDAAAAINASENGDYNTASSLSASAFQGFVTGAKRYDNAGGESWGGKIWDSVKRRYGPRFNIGN